MSRAIVAALISTPLVFFVWQASAQEPQEERWNAYGQFTHIYFEKSAFSAPYTNLNGSPNSLLTDRERSFTTSLTEYLAMRTWRGGEIQIAPEVIAELPLSGLHGFGGSFQNTELQKNGSRTPTLYRSRLFVRQTLEFGGDRVSVESAPMQLAGSTDSRRLVLTAGNLSILDIFDKNAFAGDGRQQFMSMNFLTYSAFDFGADARGYTWGMAGEYYHDDWRVRAGRFIVPRNPNQLQLDYSFHFHSDVFELEHRHKLYDKPGSVRFLFYRNFENIGRWDSAINTFLADPTKNATTCTGFNYGSTNAGAPDLCWERNGSGTVKQGIGLNIEQSIGPDIGLSFRGMKSDGHSEVAAFLPADSSLAVGVTMKGIKWKRPQDSVGLGFARNWASSAHVAYLQMGGIDGFIGDGQIRYKPESMAEAYYNINVTKSSWVTLDAQRVVNPAFNADRRGPVSMYGVRYHLEW